MKKSLISAVAVLLLAVGTVSANPIASLWDNVKATMFKEATAASFYSIRNNEWQAGVISPITKLIVANNIPLQFDYGYTHGLRSSNARGTAVVGGSVHFENAPIVKQFLQQASFVTGIDGDFGFLKHLSAGFYTGYNFDRLDYGPNDQLDYGSGIEFGFYTGLTFQF